MKPISSIAICGNTFQDSYIPQLRHFINCLLDAGFSIGVQSPFALYLTKHGIDLSGISKYDAPDSGVQLAMSIGGDGTFLRTVEWVGSHGIPVLGINTGHLGFLASFRLEDAEYLAQALKEGKTIEEPRMLIRCEADGMPEDFWPFALNEVAILKEESSSMICVSATIDSIPLTDYSADGLIISTPTGSTAYNLSAGGAILQPSLSCMSLAPIAPHSLTLRPLVVGGESVLRLTTTSRAESYRVSLDGRSFLMPVGTSLTIRKADYTVSVVRRESDNFVKILRDKLHWGSALQSDQ